MKAVFAFLLIAPQLTFAIPGGTFRSSRGHEIKISEDGSRLSVRQTGASGLLCEFRSQSYKETDEGMSVYRSGTCRITVVVDSPKVELIPENCQAVCKPTGSLATTARNVRPEY